MQQKHETYFLWSVLWTIKTSTNAHIKQFGQNSGNYVLHATYHIYLNIKQFCIHDDPFSKSSTFRKISKQSTFNFVSNYIVIPHPQFSGKLGKKFLVLYSGMYGYRLVQNRNVLTFISLRGWKNGTVFFLHLFHICLYFIYHLSDFLHLKYINTS